VIDVLRREHAIRGARVASAEHIADLAQDALR